jgi:hypothetical protein
VKINKLNIMTTVKLLKALFENFSSSIINPINPTVIYNEGWMTRLLVDISIREEITLKGINFGEIKNWTSEALIGSPFIDKDTPKNKEGYTHPDIILGDFDINYSNSGEITVNQTAQVLGIIEAKMGSNLSKDTKNAGDYNQASRNICCLASQVPNGCEIFFMVVAPKEIIEKHSINTQIELATVETQIKNRFSTSEKEVDEKILDKVKACIISAISYEEWIDELKKRGDKEIKDIELFYNKCKAHNKIKG